MISYRDDATPTYAIPEELEEDAQTPSDSPESQEGSPEGDLGEDYSIPPYDHGP